MRQWTRIEQTFSQTSTNLLLPIDAPVYRITRRTLSPSSQPTIAMPFRPQPLSASRNKQNFRAPSSRSFVFARVGTTNVEADLVASLTKCLQKISAPERTLISWSNFDGPWSLPGSQGEGGTHFIFF
jgi:hypothetical protein